MQITILGSGASAGVPMIGCKCKVCISHNIKNNRLRASILFSQNNKNLLIDTSPDLRIQALSNDLLNIDSVIYTHAHADHLAGIDEIRSFNYLNDKVIKAYATQETLNEAIQRFDYAFFDKIEGRGWYKPCLKACEIKYYQKYDIEGFPVETFKQIHGKSQSLGIRINDVAYTTDVNEMPEQSMQILEGVKLWIIGCACYSVSPTHANIDQGLKWVEKIKPDLAIFTHMGHEIDYEELLTSLPKNILPAYDGMKIQIKSAEISVIK